MGAGETNRGNGAIEQGGRGREGTEGPCAWRFGLGGRGVKGAEGERGGPLADAAGWETRRAGAVA